MVNDCFKISQSYKSIKVSRIRGLRNNTLNSCQNSSSRYEQRSKQKGPTIAASTARRTITNDDDNGAENNRRIITKK